MKKVIMISGASSGMGKEGAKLLLSEAHIVYPCAPDPEHMKDLEAAGAIPMQLDVTQPDDIDRVVNAIIKKKAGSMCYGITRDLVYMEQLKMFL